MNKSTKQGNSTANARPALGKGLASLLPNASSKAHGILADLADMSDVKKEAEKVAKEEVKTKMQTVKEVKAEMRAQITANAVASSGTQKNPALDRMPGITVVDVNSIKPNTFQPRRDFDDKHLEELAQSIKANGIIQPLLVRRDNGGLVLIAGERRLRASKLAGLKQVPVVVRNSSDKEALELALIENIQRENLNCIEVALSYFQLIEDFQLKQEEVAKRVGKDRSSVTNHLRLLRLPEEIIADLRDGRLSFGHGKALLPVMDPIARMKIRGEVLEKSLSVRDTESLVTNFLTGGEIKVKKKKEEDSELKFLAQRISKNYGAKVKIKGNEYKGTIVLRYHSKDELDQLADQLLR